MQHFILGFVVALLAVVPLAMYFLSNQHLKKHDDQQKREDDLEELGKLTGQLAHEIKNPLSTIKINLKLISEELTRGLQNRAAIDEGQIFKRSLRKIDVVEKEADRLEQILEGFLRYVDRSQLQLSNVDINQLAGDMIDFYSPQCQRHSITIRKGLCSKPLVCNADSDMLKQAILNLFINAQQAMKDGGELIIRTEKQKDNAVIEISDTGRGIKAENLERIFDAYYSSRHGGSGLGLPTTKKIIESHKGTITVNSVMGQGTSFRISLPLEVKS